MAGEPLWRVRQASRADEGPLRQLIAAARRTVLHFHDGDLARHLDVEPFLVAEQEGRPAGFLAWAVRMSPESSAALSAAGLADGMPASAWLDDLLPPCIQRLCDRGVTGLAYTGSAAWLADELVGHGFALLDYVLAFEKRDRTVPRAGNEGVLVRPVRPEDYAALVALDAEGFHRRWRNSMASLARWHETVPYFVVAVLREECVGYCYCSLLEPGHGHLVRMAVHPAWQGHGVGSRLLAEAIRFFHHEGAQRITLNTQAENKQSQWLYRSFGFRLVGQEAMALWRDL